MGDYCPGADDGACPDGRSRHDDCPGPNPNVILHDGWSSLEVPLIDHWHRWVASPMELAEDERVRTYHDPVTDHDAIEPAPAVDLTPRPDVHITSVTQIDAAVQLVLVAKPRKRESQGGASQRVPKASARKCEIGQVTRERVIKHER